VRTILITASPTSAIEDEARQANVDIILPKPFLLHELALALNSVFPDEQAVG
jgi:hypothetical protein